MKKSGFMEGAIIATLAIFFTKFLGIIYVIPFYSIVGTQGGALYGYAYNIYNLFLIISTAGIPLAISKLTSEYNTLNMKREKAYMFKSTQRIILIFSVVCFLLLFLFAPAIAHLIMGNITGGNTTEDIAFVIRCVSFAILVVPMLAISRGYLQGHGYIRASSFSQVVEQIVRIAVIIGGSFLGLKVFNLSLRSAVGIAVFGACAGAIAAFIYLIKRFIKVKRADKTDISTLKKEEKAAITKRIIMYSIPFIVVNIANSLYTSTDMILLIRGLHYLKFDTPSIEAISSVFTTWGGKINTIITSIATGIAISLVPNIAISNTKKDYKDINNKFNTLLQIFFYVALPLAIFMSIFGDAIWKIFYASQNEFGPIIIKFSIITAAVDALYIMICNGLQGLNKTKLIYTSVLLGLGINLFLDVPLMILFNNLGIYPYYGAIAATLIGYIISLIIPFVNLKKEFHLEYANTLKKLPKILLVYAFMIFLSLIYRGIIINIESRILLILLLAIFGIILLTIYILINKNELLELLGKKRDK